MYYGDYFGSATKPAIFRYDTIANIHYSANIQGYSGGVSNLIPLNCLINHFTVSLGTCQAVIYWDGVSTTAIKLREVFCVDQSYTDHVITYGKADPKRRLYVGTAQFSYCNATVPAQSSLYRYEWLFGAVSNYEGLRTAAGMGWNARTGKFYNKDVCSSSLMEYQWSPFTGELRKNFAAK